MPVEHDYSAHIDGPRPDQKRKLGELIRKQAAAELQVKLAAEELKKKVEALADLAEKQIPELLEEMGVESATTADGWTAELDKGIHTHISEENSDAAMAKLEELGQGSVIKRTFNILFGKDDQAWADKFEEQLKTFGVELDVVRKRAVHPSTLKKIVKDLIATRKLEGEALKLFGVFEKKTAKISKKGK